MRHTPAAVLRGALMTLLALSLGIPAGADEASERLLSDFGAEAPFRWYTVNDGVMGGRSRGGFLVHDGVLVFAGATNTDGGGFSSIRTREHRLDLRGASGIRLVVKGDGRRYTFRLTTATARRGRFHPSYRADFETQQGAGWQTVELPFEAFEPSWRGRRLEGPPLDLEAVDGLGIMIYDGRDGPFRLAVDSIGTYRARPAFSMAAYTWKKRPLLVFAPEADDPRLERQLADLGRSRQAFEERDMVLVVVTAKDGSIAGDDRLTRDEADALRSAYGIGTDAFAVLLVGKDGGVKRRSDDVLSLRSVYDLIDTMPMRRQEMRRE